MESWRKVWREGISLQLSTAGLQALARLLETDDARLLQGVTCEPPPYFLDWNTPVKAACPIGCCVWLGDGCETVNQVEDVFGSICRKAEFVMKEPAVCRWFTAWVDETPRDEMRRLLLEEVKRTLQLRESTHGPS